MKYNITESHKMIEEVETFNHVLVIKRRTK